MRPERDSRVASGGSCWCAGHHLGSAHAEDLLELGQPGVVVGQVELQHRSAVLREDLTPVEPGSGEIHYPAVAATLRRRGYDGVVALEGWASGDPVTALGRFRAAFS